MKKLSLLLLFASTCFYTNAQKYYGNGYTILEKENIENKTDLNVTVYKKINARTVETGLHELLQGSGWKLADYHTSDPNINRLYEQNYPDFKRILNPIKLSDALEFIAGDAWDLVIDPVNKLISFQLSEKYRCFTVEESSCES